MEEETKRSKEEVEKQECTFAPQINPVSAELAISASNRMTNGLSSRHMQSIEEALAECTFAPQTNPVKVHMQHASSYVGMNPFDRLYRGLPESEDIPSTPNRQLCLPSKKGASAPNSSKKALFRSTSTRRLSISTSASESEAQEAKSNSADLEGFHARQDAFLERKLKNVQKIKQEMETNFGNPSLNRKSLQIAEQTNPNTFLNRVQQTVEKVAMKKSQYAAVANSADPECTFAPQITLKAKLRQPRSFYDISKGDLEKRETKLKLLMMAEEEKELDGVTFKPALNKSQVESRLGIVSDPDTYMMRLQEKHQEIHARITQLKKEEERSLAECTFQPKTKEVPAFVKSLAQNSRMNREMQLASDLRSQLSDRSWH